MRKAVVFLVILAMLVLFTVPVMAAKPEINPGQEVKAQVQEKIKLEIEERKEVQKEKINGAEKYDFYLSGEVMPVPPYGGSDIEGSDERSKLIVNQPNGGAIANVTGVMKGLLPNTEYMVFISKGYTPFNALKVNLVGQYLMNYYLVNEAGALYPHELVITKQNEDGSFEGTGVGLSDSKIEVITGTIEGLTVHLHSAYVDSLGVPTGYYYDAVIAIAVDGTMSGTWVDSSANTGVVKSAGPVDVDVQSGDTAWPGLLNPALLPFTFMTDEEGHASFHINLAKEMVVFVEGEAQFSVWINSLSPAATVLISETVTLYSELETAE
ncbi:MAG: hypothetical protein JXB33_06915 [Clostridia bacterium]|nr:hypothetical protein [Clostridia bacterium]